MSVKYGQKNRPKMVCSLARTGIATQITIPLHTTSGLIYKAFDDNLV